MNRAYSLSDESVWRSLRRRTPTVLGREFLELDAQLDGRILLLWVLVGKDRARTGAPPEKDQECVGRRRSKDQLHGAMMCLLVF